jgi:hypothetical protein
MIFGMRKALVDQMLPVFEPKRSNYPNRLNKKELAQRKENCNRQSAIRRIQIKLPAISTVGGCG